MASRMQRRWVSILNYGIALGIGVLIGSHVLPRGTAATPLAAACAYQIEVAMGERGGQWFEGKQITAWVTNFDTTFPTDEAARNTVADASCEEGKFR
jgi:hypothetical protein